MGDGALGSDHINYLVLRYLQESGHENAAKALHQDWQRAQEYHDPENLPFASLVKQHELVQMIQDGLFHDQLHAEITNQSRRFTFTRPSLSRRSPNLAAHRSSAQSPTEQDDFPMPTAKRARKSNESVNGDSMEIDQEEDGDAEPAPEPEAEPDPEPEPVATTSAGTQTDKRLKSKSETMYWALDQPDASIMHALWNPQLSMATRLLTVGESLCRFYDLPAHAQASSERRARHVDAETMSKGSVITAACWHPSGRYATCALDSTRQLAGGTHESVRSMFDATVHGGKRFYDLHGYLLQHAAIVVALRYNHSGSRLLSVSTNMKRGLVEVWDANESATSLDPVAVKLFNQPVIDAVWASEDSIVVCGENRLDFYEIHDASLPDGADANGDSFASTGTRNFALVYSHPTDKQWDKVRYDAVHQVVAATSTADDCMVLLAKNNNRWLPLPGFPTDGLASKRATAMAFQPLQALADDETGRARRLAITHDSGLIRVYQITNSSCETLHQFTMGPHEAALALSWSPTGSCLAVASEEAVKIWDLNAGSVPLLTWRAAATHWYQGDENNLPNGDETGDEPSLNWDAEGKRLIFAVGRKMAAIRLLIPSKTPSHTNDEVSPVD